MSIPNIKFKTEYCNSWKQGKVCEKGNGCFFAHGEIELRTIQQNHKDITTQNSVASLEIKPHNYKTIFCKFYGEGTCKLGDHCTYAHERRQKRKKRPSQDYNQQENLEQNISWDNYQLYQYYAQTYMYNYMQPNYNYDLQTFNNPQEQNYQSMAKEEQNNCVISNSNEVNNIREEITFNDPMLTKNTQQSEGVNAVKKQENEEKI